jgi:hypothetical protein
MNLSDNCNRNGTRLISERIQNREGTGEKPGVSATEGEDRGGAGVVGYASQSSGFVS